MKLNAADLSRKFQFPLLLACGSMPLILLLFACWAGDALALAWVLAGAYLLLAIPGLTVPGKWRLLWGLICAGLLLALGGGMTFYAGSICPLIAAVFFAALLMWSLRTAAWSWDEEFPFFTLFLGLAIHIGAQLLLFFIHKAGLADLRRAEPGLLVSFWGYMLLVLLSMNRDSLFFAAKGRQRASAAMRRMNLVLVLGLALAAMLISAMPAAASAVSAFFAWLKDLMVGDPTSESDPGINQFSPSEIPAATEPGITAEEVSPFMMALDKLLILLTRIFLAAAALYGLYMLVKLLRLLVRRLLKWLSRYTASVSEDYVDEVTDIRDANSQKQTLLQRLRRMRSASAGEALSPQQRIRQRYLRLLTKRRWGPDATARENLPADAAGLYERARYSGHPITGEEAAAFHAKTRRL